MRYILFLLFAATSLMASAQRNIIDDLRQPKAGQGTVTIHQSPAIEALLGARPQHPANGEKMPMLKARGFRVQVYAGNGSRVAREEANEVAEQLKQEFPDLPVYTFFRSPRWLCRVGDYRSVEEADAAMRMLRNTGKFKEVSVVREQINIPLE